MVTKTFLTITDSQNNKTNTLPINWSYSATVMLFIILNFLKKYIFTGTRSRSMLVSKAICMFPFPLKHAPFPPVITITSCILSSERGRKKGGRGRKGKKGAKGKKK